MNDCQHLSGTGQLDPGTGLTHISCDECSARLSSWKPCTCRDGAVPVPTTARSFIKPAWRTHDVCNGTAFIAA
jgi:hypothetical protein